jgi:hypothetical protein
MERFAGTLLEAPLHKQGGAQARSLNTAKLLGVSGITG